MLRLHVALCTRQLPQTCGANACIESRRSIVARHARVIQCLSDIDLVAGSFSASSHENGTVTMIDHQRYRHYSLMYPFTLNNESETPGVYAFIESRSPIAACNARSLPRRNISLDVEAIFVYKSYEQAIRRLTTNDIVIST